MRYGQETSNGSTMSAISGGSSAGPLKMKLQFKNGQFLKQTKQLR